MADNSFSHFLRVESARAWLLIILFAKDSLLVVLLLVLFLSILVGFSLVFIVGFHDTALGNLISVQLPIVNRQRG